jgi:phosphopantothenoylcysteine decarboxylase/phosphopantothenate--cysteine ligase
MNDGMFTNKIFQENIAKLKKHNIKFIDPLVGNLACGRKGPGHLAEVADIVKAVKKVL